jgi:hypothetical protein
MKRYMMFFYIVCMGLVASVNSAVVGGMPSRDNLYYDIMGKPKPLMAGFFGNFTPQRVQNRNEEEAPERASEIDLDDPASDPYAEAPVVPAVSRSKSPKYYGILRLGEDPYRGPAKKVSFYNNKNARKAEHAVISSSQRMLDENVSQDELKQYRTETKEQIAGYKDRSNEKISEEIQSIIRAEQDQQATAGKWFGGSNAVMAKKAERAAALKNLADREDYESGEAIYEGRRQALRDELKQLSKDIQKKQKQY